MASSRCRVSTPPSPSETKVDTSNFRIDTLDLFADDQAVLCQIKKRVLLSHIQETSLFRRLVIAARVKMLSYLTNGCQLRIKGFGTFLGSSENV